MPGQRRKVLLQRLLAVVIVLAVAGLGYLLVFTPVVGVGSVEVIGVKRLEKAKVLKLADIAKDYPMVRVNTDGAEERIATLPQVEQVEVSRSWPSTISIEITERRPIAYFDAQDGLWLVDRFGVPFHRVGQRPGRLPELKIATVASDDRTTRAATSVLTAIGSGLRDRVNMITARSPHSLTMNLSGGQVVRWGDDSQIERKSRVLRALLTRPGKYYDVSSPELPTVK